MWIWGLLALGVGNALWRPVTKTLNGRLNGKFKHDDE
jgi:hypothetical protein